MAELKTCAVIFDVDGVLLELTRPEEEIFFEALGRFVPTESLSRDWNSYRIRNDDDIVSEILERNALPQSAKPEMIQHYLSLLSRRLSTPDVPTKAITGAARLVAEAGRFATLGIATANFRDAALMRLSKVDLWSPVASHAFGADGGGHKSSILARTIASVGRPNTRVIYIGDNRNDVIAGLENGCHFIGFSTNPERRQELGDAGARYLASNHLETLSFVRQFSGI